MKFKLEFDCDNAAFYDVIDGDLRRDRIDSAVERCLIRLLNGHNDGLVVDMNGNTIGSWELG